MSNIFSRPASPSYANELLIKINYHKNIQGSEIAVKNLQNINSKLNNTSIYSLAYLSLNEAISEEERKIFNECLKAKALQEYELYSKAISNIKK